LSAVRTRHLPVAALLAVLLAACSVPADSKPRTIPPNQVAFDLLTPSTTTTATTAPAATVGVTVYMMGPERLAAVQRTVASPPSLGTVLATLVRGPTPTEEQTGLRSAINSQMHVIGTQMNGSTAIINMSDGFSGIGVQEQIDAVAQIVYTATAIEGVDSVQITLNAVPVEVPRDDGSSTKDPLRRSDYGALAPS